MIKNDNQIYSLKKKDKNLNPTWETNTTDK